MIVVTGATGQLGRQVVAGLLREVPGAQLGVSVQDPEKAAELKQLGVRVCRGDFAEPASLAAAFDGADQVLLISANKVGDEAVRLHSNAIDAAKRAGVRRILYTSHQAANAQSAFMPARNHAATEALLAASGLAYVSLRNGFYAESALFQLGGLRRDGKIALPADGVVSWTARGDLAVAAVAALTQAELFDGISPPLTGPATWDFEALARMASDILGREIARETISDEAYREGLIAHGIPKPMAALLGGLYTASRAGEFAVVDPTLARVLGRTPTGIKQVLSEFLNAN